MKFLMVCTGNICRSPTADAVLAHLAAEQKVKLIVDSAGTHNYHVGEAPDVRTIHTAAQYGVKMEHLRARKITAKDFDDFDVILAMDNGHLQILRKLKPAGSKAEVALFMRYATGESADVKDPYYGNQQGFEDVFAQVKRGCEAILQKMQKA